MIKHVGRHNNEKIVIMYREVPDEAHMALIVYSTKLPSLIHDELMKVLESEVGQNEANLADAAFRHIMPDGRNCLNTIHKDNFMKKVPTNQVIVTPTANSNCRLDELNKILNEMATGDDAVKRLAELDANQGLRDPSKSVNTTSSADVTGEVAAATDSVLTDTVIATQQREQAARMRNDAEQLLAEATRLDDEAEALAPKDKKNARKTTKKKATRKKRATKKKATA
jgi:hypothetical protein